eukprot:TRINITY_DN18485_c0_g1_i1.p1 TRINITY_DN18485_c0_g1~~TRINITY_DN18485_c0_g1_i1.p1  ORF type:complete len:317 (+),score=1.00 TRINITY_DN18485_c0_g1_i1:65-952(+)
MRRAIMLLSAWISDVAAQRYYHETQDDVPVVFVVFVLVPLLLLCLCLASSDTRQPPVASTRSYNVPSYHHAPAAAQPQQLGFCQPQPAATHRVLMYHGTSSSAARSIELGGFRASHHGLLGRGVYMSCDLSKAERYGPVVLECSVDVGSMRCIDRQDHPDRRMWPVGSDSKFIPEHARWTHQPGEVYCIRDPARIQIQRTHRVRFCPCSFVDCKECCPTPGDRENKKKQKEAEFRQRSRPCDGCGKACIGRKCSACLQQEQADFQRCAIPCPECQNLMQPQSRICKQCWQRRYGL